MCEISSSVEVYSKKKNKRRPEMSTVP